MAAIFRQRVFLFSQAAASGYGLPSAAANKGAHSRQSDSLALLQKELTELETATNRLYEAVEKGLLPMDQTLTERAQKHKARRDAVMIEMAQTRRHKEMPVALLTARQVEAFGIALRTRVMDSEGGFSKRNLREFVSEIGFDGERVLMRGKKATLKAAAAQNEMGTASVPISVPNWPLALGSNQGPAD